MVGYLGMKVKGVTVKNQHQLPAKTVISQFKKNHVKTFVKFLNLLSRVFVLKDALVELVSCRRASLAF